MDVFQRHRAAVDDFWPEVEAFFDGLHGELFAEGVLLQERLAMDSSPTGAVGDVLRAPHQPPVLHWHRWVLDDLEVEGDRGRIEAALFAAAFLSYALVAADETSAGLATVLTRAVDRRFADAVPPDADFWDRYRYVWNDVWRRTPPTTAARYAPLTLPPIAAAYAAGRGELAGTLIEVLSYLSTVLADRRDVLAMRRDLSHGIVSPAVRQMMDAADVAPSDPPETVLGAILVTGAIDSLAPSWESATERAAKTASSHGLATFERYAHDLEAALASLSHAFRVSGGGPSGPVPPMVAPAPDIASTVDAARRFLLADPSFREAWEVHRWGMGGASKVTARFPSALVIEALAKHGADVAELVDDFYREAENRAFAYYDHPGLPYRETDTIGAMLRLSQYTDSAPQRSVLDGLVAEVAAHVTPDGRLPVWLVDGVPDVPLLGEGCGTIEVNLLRGLIVYQPNGIEPLIDRSKRRLLGVFARRGAAVSVNYPSSYLLAAMGALLGVSPDERGWVALRAAIEVEADADLSPQTAACLILACSHEATDALLDPDWVGLVADAQSFDGSWLPEPMFFAPNRTRPAWHRSRLLTSALCFDALATVVERT